jgi:hypothetical protein
MLHHIKNELKIRKDLKCKTGNYKIVDENIGEMLHDVILGSDFIGGGA